MSTNNNQGYYDVESFLKRFGNWTLADMDKMPIRKKNPNDPNEVQQFVPRSGLIKIVPVKPRKLASGGNAETSYTRTVVYDSDRRVVYGQPWGMSPDGAPKWKRIVVNDERQFDLSKPGDRADFYVLLHCTEMEGGPNFRGTAKFKMIDPEKSAREFVEKRKLSKNADEIVANLSDVGGLSELTDFAILFGINPMQSTLVKQQMLFEKADTDPQSIVMRYNDPDRKIWVLVKKAVTYQVIERKPDGLYYGGVAMGSAEINAVARLKQQPELMKTMNDLIDKKMGKVETVLPISQVSEEKVFEEVKAEQKKSSGKKDAAPAFGE